VSVFRNNAGQTAADVALALNQPTVVDVLRAAGSGLWNAVTRRDEVAVRRLVESLWFRVDLRRDGMSLLASATTTTDHRLVTDLKQRAQYVRFQQ